MQTNGTRAKARPATSEGYIPRCGIDTCPIPEVHAFWLAGMSCDGCSIAAVGAQNPRVEQLITGSIPGLPKVILHHPVLSVTAGKDFMAAHHLAKEGKLGAPYVVIQEGSVADEDIAGAFGGYWSGMGVDHEKLTYRFQGRDFRLTDVSGKVVEGLLA